MRALLILFLTLFAFFSIQCDKADDQTTTSGLVINVPDGVPINSTLNTQAENAWLFVRQSATWGDSNSKIIDNLIVNLMNSGLLTREGTYTDSNVTVGTQAMTVRLTVNASASISGASAYTGSKTFDHKFEIWRNSDNAKALELFFDSVESLTSDGVLMYYQLNVLSPAEFNGDDVIVESYSFQSADGPKQTYSWSGGAIVSGGSGQAGRVVIEEMGSGTLFCFKSVVKLSGSLDWCTGSNSEYYSLGYTQNLTGEGEVTAKFGFEDNSIDNTGQLCGASNSLNYGTFNQDGFISDGNSTVGASFPATTRVDTLFSEINTVGAGAWDDTTKSKIDALNIQFVSSTAP